MEEGIGEEKKSMSAVVIVLIVVGILVGLAVVGTVIFAGITFLWVGSLTETNESYNVFELSGDIDGDEDTLTLTILSGTANWNDLEVIVEGVTLTTTTTTASAGDEVVFSSPLWDPVPGTTYMVNVVFISDKMPLWGRSIEAQ